MHFWIFSIRRIRERICRFLQDTCRIDYINGIDTLPPPLSKEEEAAVFAALEAGDSNARETLIVHNLRLVVYIARKFESSGLGLEDLISIGTIGLIKAVGTFRPAKKIKLATYASRCIENEILMVLRKNAQSRSEISIDEPLSADWDGNELLLSDDLHANGPVGIMTGYEEKFYALGTPIHRVEAVITTKQPRPAEEKPDPEDAEE